jgi:1,4-dihydroxy-2-naphthoate polyprenyltransferase
MNFGLHKSTLQLLRLKFSFFLMPVYWFALSQVDIINVTNAVLVFFILHFLVYPASNGYNSYMDKDTSSIGGIEKPMQPTKQLFYCTIVLDVLALLLCLFISKYLLLAVGLYILASRAYSNRTIRLKKYPIIGFIVTAFFQGACVYFIVYHGSDVNNTLDIQAPPMVASSFLIGSFYPLTQIYQHKEDAADGVKTLSILLGLNGTFIFAAIMYSIAMNILAVYFYSTLALNNIFVFAFCGLPILVYFFWWMLKVRKDKTSANFKNTMQMNIIASVCTNVGFILVLLIEKL